MTDRYQRNPYDPTQMQVIANLVRLDEQNTIQRFPAGAQLTTKTLSMLGNDILLSGWVGLGQPHWAENHLIGVLLPGDKVGAVLRSQLCSAVALTPVHLASEETDTDEMHEIQHLVRQCVRACHFSALDRIEDFFLESYQRLETVGLASDWTFEFPLPQATLGNILGLSTAHVNRAIKQLQAEARIQIIGRSVTLLKHSSIASAKPSCGI